MKQLVIFAGPPGTGKSTVARALGFAHLEMDAARVGLLPGSAHTRADRAIAYRAILWAAAQLLRFTGTVICDGGFGHAEDRELCETTAREAGAELCVAEFLAPIDVLLVRNRERRGHHPGLDLTDARVAELVNGYSLWGKGIVLDGTQPIDRCAERIRRYLTSLRHSVPCDASS